MIAELIVILIGFLFLFYLIKEVGKKISIINEYELSLFRKEYQFLLKSAKDDKQQIKELTKHMQTLERQVIEIKKIKEDRKNVFSLNKKK
jgi:hypothetical protein